MTAAEEVHLTWLYVPGDRPDVVRKARDSGADVVIVDLEDAVAPDRKEYARSATAELLTEPAADTATPVHVRVHTEADVLALAGLPGLAELRLPKITHAATVHHIAALAPGVALCPLLESALGIEHAYTVAASTPRSARSPSARPISGPIWGCGTTGASTGHAAGWWSPPARPASPRRPSPCSRTYGTWTACGTPARTGARWGSSAGRRSTPGSYR